MKNQNKADRSEAAKKGAETRRYNQYLKTSNADSVASARAHSDVVLSDGWTNLLTGLGMSGYDKKQSTFFMAGTRLSEPDIRDLIVYNGLAKRIVNLMAEDMLRQWFTIDGDTDLAIPKSIRKIKGRDGANGKKEIYRALKWSRAYGGALVVVGAMDGKEITEPLDENRIQNIEFLHAYHRYRVSRVRYYLDSNKPNYYETEIYMVNPPRGAGFQIHESRVLVFDGEDCPPETRLMNYGWGESVLQAVFTRLRGLGEAYLGCEHIISEFVLNFLKMKGLSNYLSSNQEALIQKKLNYMDLSKHIINTVLLDDGEEISRVSASVSGLPELMGKLIQATASETGYPVRKLFGEVNVGSGLSNDRTEETNDYYAVAQSEQEEKLRGPLERLCHLQMLSKSGPTGGKLIVPAGKSDWQLTFCPLTVMSQKEITEQRKSQAEVDEKYVNMNAVAPEEIRQSRFGGDTYSHETRLDPKLKLTDTGEGDDNNDLGNDKKEGDDDAKGSGTDE